PFGFRSIRTSALPILLSQKALLRSPRRTSTDHPRITHGSRLSHRISGLKAARTVARKVAGALPVEVLINLGLNVEDIWRRCSTDDERREVLSGQIERLTIYRGNRGGRNLDRSRVKLVWRTDEEQVAPD